MNIFETIFKNLTYTKNLYRIVEFKIFDKIEKTLLYDKKSTYTEKDFEIENPKYWKYEFTKEEYYSSIYDEDFFVLDLV